MTPNSAFPSHGFNLDGQQHKQSWASNKYFEIPGQINMNGKELLNNYDTYAIVKKYIFKPPIS